MLKIDIFCIDNTVRYIFIITILFFCSSLVSVAEGVAGIVPDRELEIISPELPVWKKDWELARSYVRNGDFFTAATLYSKVLQNRPEINQVRWEYCQIAFYNDDIATSTALLSGLLEQFPDNLEIVLFAARVFFADGQYAKSSEYYQKIFDSTPFTKQGLEALKGLVVSFLKQNRKAEALPLMRQLTARTEDNIDIIKELALVTSSLGLLKESENYYQELLKRKMISAEDALEASRVFEKNLEYSELARTLKEEYLNSFSGDLLVRSRLGESYLQAGLQEKAVEHLVILAESGETEQWLRAATIYEYILKRQDKALFCYEQYLQLNPENKYIKGKITELQEQIAEELLVLVETLGAERVWFDLDKVIDSPETIYFNMLRLAEETENKKLSLALLDVIEANSEIKDKYKLAFFYDKLGEEQKSYNLLKQTSKQDRDAFFYQKKIELEKKLGLGLAEYLSRFDHYFLIERNSREIPYLLAKSVEYGIIGNLDKLLEVKSVRTALFARQKLFKRILDSYADAGEFATAFKLLEDYKKSNNNDFSNSLKAELLQKRGFDFEAEQVLRQKLVESNVRESLILKELVELELDNGNRKNAWNWYEQFLEKRNRYSLDQEDLLILDFIQAKLLVEDGQYQPAAYQLKAIQKSLKKIIVNDFDLKREVNFTLSDLLFRQGKFKECVEKSQKLKVTSASYYLSLAKIENREPALSRLLTVALYLKKNKQRDKANKYLRRLLENVPESTVAKKQLADNLLAAGKFAEALDLYKELISESKDMSYFNLRLADIYGGLEENKKEMSLLLEENISTDFYCSDTLTRPCPQKNERALKIIRALWRTGQRTDSLTLYSKTLTELQRSLEQISALESGSHGDRDGYLDQLTAIFYPKSPVRDKIMEPGFLLTFHENKEINVLNHLYAQYRWHRLISLEYEARKLTHEKKLFLAEKNYRKLFEKEGSSEAMMDLATIYKRLGYYNREAMVYQTVKESGLPVAELEKSIEENRQKRKPQLALEFDFSNKDGRDGSLDMLRLQYGTSFWFAPAVNTDLFIKYIRTTFEDDLFDKESSYFGFGGRYFWGDDTFIYGDLGVEALTGSDELKLLGNLKINHRINENIRAYLLYDKRRVDDNIIAVEKQIFAEDIEVGLTFETDFGVELGGDYRYTMLTGDNHQQRAHGYLFYNIFGDKTRLDFHYDFEYIYSDLSSNEVSYWSPQDYRIHELSLYFEHQLSDDSETNQLEKYYSLEYAIGFEDDQNIRYTGKCDIFLEMSEHYLLKGSLLYSRSNDYDESRVKLLFVHRW